MEESDGTGGDEAGDTDEVDGTTSANDDLALVGTGEIGAEGKSTFGEGDAHGGVGVKAGAEEGADTGAGGDESGGGLGEGEVAGKGGVGAEDEGNVGGGDLDEGDTGGENLVGGER